MSRYRCLCVTGGWEPVAPGSEGERQIHRIDEPDRVGAALPLLQHDPPHRTAAGAIDAGQQLRPARAPAAAVAAHPVEDVADQHLALGHVRLGDHPLLPAAIAHDPQEPRRERAQRLVEGLLAGRQQVVTVGRPLYRTSFKAENFPQTTTADISLNDCPAPLELKLQNHCRLLTFRCSSV
jgi:hypothetical protein